jgi:hypothetical protein
MKRCLVFFCVAFSVASSGRVLAPDRMPVQAGLLRALDAAHLKVGDSVLAKVSTKWQGPECTLREGAILKGRVVAQTAHSKTSKISEIALLFDSGECGGSALKPLPLTVAAVMAGDPRRDGGMYESQPLSDAVGLTLKGGARSLSSASSTVFNEPYRYKGRTSVKPGEVVGIKGVQLKVGEGPEGSSVLSASGHNLRLDSGALLLLVPNLTVSSTANSVSTPAPPSSSVEIKEPSVLEPAEDTEVCSPPQCSVALGGAEVQDNASAWATLPVRDLGYGHSQHDLYGFDYDSALAYLDATHLL